MTKLPPFASAQPPADNPGRFVMATQGCWDPAAAWKVLSRWGFPATGFHRGEARTEAEARAYLDQADEDRQMTVHPPQPASDMAVPRSLNLMPSLFCHPNGKVAGRPPRMEWTIHYKLFHYVTVQWPNGDPFPDPASPALSDWFLQVVRDLQPIFAPSFSFGCPTRDLELPINDPRYRAWGVNYYGPELVETIGRDALLSAPAWSVTPDATTKGIWLQLDELPFVNSSQLEARREAVEQHLRLAELFPFSY